ncbi:hypothetical protein Hanom_Chr02g00136601 [Helianthus anomalus]
MNPSWVASFLLVHIKESSDLRLLLATKINYFVMHSFEHRTPSTIVRSVPPL